MAKKRKADTADAEPEQGQKQQKKARGPSTAAPAAAVVPADSGFKNKEKVLILSTRGITFRCARRLPTPGTTDVHGVDLALCRLCVTIICYIKSYSI